MYQHFCIVCCVWSISQINEEVEERDALELRRELSEQATETRYRGGERRRKRKGDRDR